jgi:hypothetical protein
LCRLKRKAFQKFIIKGSFPFAIHASKVASKKGVCQLKKIVDLSLSQKKKPENIMNSKFSLIAKSVLGILIILLGFKLFSIIQEPIDFENLKDKRYAVVKDRLEKIRDAQKAFRTEYLVFAEDLESLIAFVDTGKSAIIERKDSSFMYYDLIYLQEMEKDTIIVTVLGYEPVKAKLFGADFDPNSLRIIPFSDNVPFIVSAGKIKISEVIIPVFEAKAPDTSVFHDVLSKYDQYIDNDYALQVGDLKEATLSGNWK